MGPKHLWHGPIYQILHVDGDHRRKIKGRHLLLVSKLLVKITIQSDDVVHNLFTCRSDNYSLLYRLTSSTERASRDSQRASGRTWVSKHQHLQRYIAEAFASKPANPAMEYPFTIKDETEGPLTNVPAGYINFIYLANVNWGWRTNPIFPFNEPITERYFPIGVNFNMDPAEPFPSSQVVSWMAKVGLAQLLLRQWSSRDPTQWSVAKQTITDKATLQVTMVWEAVTQSAVSKRAITEFNPLSRGSGHDPLTLPPPPPVPQFTENTVHTGKPMDPRSLMLAFNQILFKHIWNHPAVERTSLAVGEKITWGSHLHNTWISIERLDDGANDQTWEQFGLPITQLTWEFADKDYYGSIESTWGIQGRALPFLKVVAMPIDAPGGLAITASDVATPFDELAEKPFDK